MANVLLIILFKAEYFVDASRFSKFTCKMSLRRLFIQ